MPHRPTRSTARPRLAAPLRAGLAVGALGALLLLPALAQAAPTTGHASTASISWASGSDPWRLPPATGPHPHW